MFELIFIIVFVATLVVTGVTLFTVLAATGFGLLVLLLLGMVGMIFQVLPWLLAIALGVWFFKNYVYNPR